jgi:hypothetical protein
MLHKPVAVKPALLVALPSAVYGYTDPGTGVFLYQAAYASVLGGMFYFRRLIDWFWQKRK